MKKWIKYTAVFGAVFTVLGFGTARAAWIYGGRWEGWDRLAKLQEIKAVEEKMKSLEEDWEEEDEPEVILKEEVTESRNLAENLDVLSFPAVPELSLSLWANQVTVREGEGGDIRILCSEQNRHSLKVNQDGDELEVTCRKKKHDETDAVLEIIVPAGYSFRDVEMDLEVAECLIWGLDAGELSIDLVGGNVVIQESAVSEADFQCSGGNIEYAGTIKGNASCECAAGNIYLRLAQKETDFNYSAEGVGGAICIGGLNLDGLAFERKLPNQALWEMELECAAGNITVEFQDEETNEAVEEGI